MTKNLFIEEVDATIINQTTVICTAPPYNATLERSFTSLSLFLGDTLFASNSFDFEYIGNIQVFIISSKNFIACNLERTIQEQVCSSCIASENTRESR